MRAKKLYGEKALIPKSGCNEQSDNDRISGKDAKIAPSGSQYLAAYQASEAARPNSPIAFPVPASSLPGDGVPGGRDRRSEGLHPLRPALHKGRDGGGSVPGPGHSEGTGLQVGESRSLFRVGRHQAGSQGPSGYRD